MISRNVILSPLPSPLPELPISWQLVTTWPSSLPPIWAQGRPLMLVLNWGQGYPICCIGLGTGPIPNIPIICHLIFICMHSGGCHLANFNEEQLSNYQAVRSRKYFRIKNLSHAKVSIVWLQLSWSIITLVPDPYYVFDWILSWYSVMIYILLITRHLSLTSLSHSVLGTTLL